MHNFFSPSEFVFPEPPEEVGGRPKKDWDRTAFAECGWNNQWQRMAPPSHKKPELWPYLTTVPQCVDPRGCKEPPLRNDRIWGSYEDSKTKSLEVGTVYWYECRYGVFDFNNGTKDIPSTLLPYMELTCVNDDR